MSGRGSSPKIASFSSTEPASLPSRVITFSSISGALPARLLARAHLLARARRFGRRGLHGFRAREAERTGRGRFLGKVLFYGVANRDPAAFRARDGALDQNEP